ncbi:MAG: aldo/keto reductase [Chloroflexi bacterium]|nr:aldo/keto reductase [Chloroflexota bacterium]
MKYELPTAVLGRTGLRVTRLGIGGAYNETVEGYRRALDTGVTYVDTARAYRDGKDEEVLGEALLGRRQGLVLATKSGKRSAKEAREELETSLRLLRTDYVDIWQMHYVNTPEDLEQILAPGGALEAAWKAREEGLTRFIGVTGHKWELIAKAVDTGEFDTVLCWYNCAYKEPETTVFPAAMRHNTGVVIMNASRNDKLFGEKAGVENAPDPVDFYRYVLSHEAVDVTIVGLRNVELFERIAAGLAERETLSPEERAALEEYGARLRATGKLEMG